MHTPTIEQSAIIQAAAETEQNLMITAYAGTAKTTTLEMVAHALPEQNALALAFNVKIKNELVKRFPPGFTVLTLNGLGHRAWGTAIGKRLTLDENKLAKLVTQAIKKAHLDADRDSWTTLLRLLSAAMMQGLVPKGALGNSLIPDTNDSWEAIAETQWLEVNQTMIDLARVVLKESIQLGYQGTVSFDDQIYLSALFGGVFPRYPLVMVDEAQDLSPLNHVQIRRTAAGRLIVVGDPHQAIYAFRGADHKSMNSLRSVREKWTDLPLTLTFRCPKIVVERQQAHASGFTAHEHNTQGVFLTWEEWSWPMVKALGEDVFILSRHNAPLLSMAFKLLRQGISCKMLGRDIGKNLIALSRKILPLDETSSTECVVQITQWGTSQVDLAKANKKPEAGIIDRMESLLAVLESAPGITTAGALRRALEELFSRNQGQVVLATGHRAKGLEADIVVHLDPWRIALLKAKDEVQAIQEKNLLYVIETRARHVLIEAKLASFH